MTKPLPHAASGDRRSDDLFAGLYVRYMPRLVALCRQHLHDSRDDAEAVAHEAFARALASAGTVPEGAAIWPWLATTARRLCIDTGRHAGRDSRIRDRTTGQRFIPQPQPDDVIAEREQRSTAMRAYESLTPRHRRLIALRDLEGLSYDEIAALDGVTVEAVRGSLKRARAALRRSFVRLGGGLAAIPGFTAVRRAAARVVNGPAWATSWPFASRDALWAAALAAAVLGFSQPSVPQVPPTGERAASSPLDAPAPVEAVRRVTPRSAATPVGARATTAAPASPSPDEPAHGTAPEPDIDDARVWAVSEAPDGSLFATGTWREGAATSSAPLFRSTDGGVTWQWLEATGLRAYHLQFPPAFPADNRIFASSHLLGLAMSRDGGRTFVTVSPLPGVAAIAPDFSAGNPTMLLGRAPGWSYDAAYSAALPSGLSVPAAPHETNFAFSAGFATDKTVYVGANSFIEPGHSLSVPSVYVCRVKACTQAALGDEWAVPPRFAVADDATDPTVWAWASKHLWRSGDGVSFERVPMPSRLGFLSDAAMHGGVTYVGVQAPGSNGGGVYRSDDGGGTWRRLPLLHSVADIEVLRDGTIVVAAPANPSSVLVSRDGGQTWKP